MNTDCIHTGDAFEVLPELPAESVHAVVTDPPYGLAFMGRDWDDFEPKEYQEWCQEWAREVKRVLKPGGHLLAFSGNRTHHRLFTGVEDAGFEIRDTLTWHYGSGFPKASDIGKTIDKRADAEREVVGVKPGHEDFAGRSTDGHRQGRGVTGDGDHGREWHKGQSGENYHKQTAPATEQAKKWDGWKTGLKPATEYVVMARKPFDGATVDCVLEHGTGALNIEACRVGSDVDKSRPAGDMAETQEKYGHYDGDQTNGSDTGGRYPSNVVFDETEAEQLDTEVGDKPSCDPHELSDKGERNVYSDDKQQTRQVGYDDSGGPSRYFYTSKADKSERTENGKIDNAHPTVKPQDLMGWLIKMVTRETQIVLDPFGGSGTTCKAAKALNRKFIGIEKQAKWADVARVRCNLTPEDPSVVRDDGEQHGLESFTD